MIKKPIKMICWNVNGMRAVVRNDFFKSFRKINADIFAIQETKLQESQLTEEIKKIEGYESYWSHSTVKKGYSGVGIYTRIKPKTVTYDLGISRYDDEGRTIEMDFGDFVFFNVYFPNGKMSDARLRYKLDFYKDFFEYADSLKSRGRSLVIAGDFNTAHNEIDLKNPKANEKYSGFLRIERDLLDRMVANGYVDTFRYFYPDTVKYSWWSYRFNARAKNIGWRIDYFFVTEDIVRKGWVKDSFIDNDIFGSDHCPIGLVMAG
ncbi:MAG TPA: exodeoxyribonuclease III [Desulfobacterales bacterium]|nr:exodeoxyribonuclease III [Desulfobacterales bacterium]